MLGLNPTKLSTVFNQYGGKPFREKENVFGKMDKTKFINFLKSGIGYGYHYVHAKNQVKYIILMTKAFMNKLAQPKSHCIMVVKQVW